MSSTATSSQSNNTTQTDSSSAIESLLTRYQVVVFTLAMHLLNDPRAAQAVVEEVFLKISKEQNLPEDEKALEEIIHSTTYDVAISALVSLKRAEKSH